jgi:hypothetical protein
MNVEISPSLSVGVYRYVCSAWCDCDERIRWAKLTLRRRGAVVSLRRVASPTICRVHWLGWHPVARRGLRGIAHGRCHVAAGVGSGPAKSRGAASSSSSRTRVRGLVDSDGSPIEPKNRSESAKFLPCPSRRRCFGAKRGQDSRVAYSTLFMAAMAFWAWSSWV